MKKILIILLLLVTITALLNSLDSTSRKMKDNPVLAHFLNLDELLLNEDYERNFTPTDPPTGIVRQTSEFEQMEGVLVVYPLGVPYSLIAEMSQDIKIYTIVDSYQQSQCETNYQNNNVNMANCAFINAPTNSYWVRDFGPWFIDNGGEIAIVDFPYNRPRPDDDEIPIVVADYFGLDLYGMDLESTGGNYMCDGNFIGASTDLVYEENSGLTTSEIDQLVLDYLGIENYHVTLDPLGDYIKHIDCWGKFLDVDKVLIGQVPQNDYRYNDFEFVADYFAVQTSAWGNNFEVHRIYTPGGYSQATPYTNSLILNSKVFVPQTGSQWDDEALATYNEVMPGYEISVVYSNGWYDTDALHCRTRGVADRGMLYIDHFPLLGAQAIQDEYQIAAYITPYSGEEVINDSLMVYFSVNNGTYEPINMSLNSGNLYYAAIPAQNAGSTIKYYIHAVDESGRSANHPIIGAYEPHEFFIEGTPPPAELVVNPQSYSLELGQNESTTEILELSNIGGLSLSYQVSGDQDWISVNTTSGMLMGGQSEDIEISIDTAGLTPATYYGNIVIADDREETLVGVELVVTGVGTTEEITDMQSELIGNYPNPFNPDTTIKYTLKNNAKVTLSIYNTKGQLVRVLVDSIESAGTRSIIWNGKDTNNQNVSSGIYYTTLIVNDEESIQKNVRKIVLMK